MRLKKLAKFLWHCQFHISIFLLSCNNNILFSFQSRSLVLLLSKVGNLAATVCFNKCSTLSILLCSSTSKGKRTPYYIILFLHKNRPKEFHYQTIFVFSRNAHSQMQLHIRSLYLLSKTDVDSVWLRVSHIEFWWGSLRLPLVSYSRIKLTAADWSMARHLHESGGSGTGVSLYTPTIMYYIIMGVQIWPPI